MKNSNTRHHLSHSTSVPIDGMPGYCRELPTREEDPHLVQRFLVGVSQFSKRKRTGKYPPPKRREEKKMGAKNKSQVCALCFVM